MTFPLPHASRVAFAAVLTLGGLSLCATGAEAQRRRGGWGGGGECMGMIEPNRPYDGRFIFARIRYAEHYSN